MNLAPLPVDTITSAEWAAGIAVRAARDIEHTHGIPPHLAAEMALDAITGSIERSLRVMATIDDAHRCLARAVHPAGADFLGHGSHALPEHHPVDDRTPGAGEPMDPGTSLARPVEHQGSGCWNTTPAREGEKAGTLAQSCARSIATSPSDHPGQRGGHLDARQQTGGRHTLALATAVTIAAAVAVMLSRGGWT